MSHDVYPSAFPPLSPLPTHLHSESRVLIILTGGTICMDPTPAGLLPSPDFLNTHLRPRPTFNCPTPSPLPSLTSFSADGIPRETPSLRTQPSKHNRYVLYTVHELSPLLDSSSISAPGWTQLARLLAHNYAHYDGFVIIHGTDSLAYTASALSYMLLNLAKPVVLTGSQLPMSALHSDATDNLIGALACAGHFPIPEVGLFFRNKLLRGCRSTKASADAFDAFASPNCPPLAEVKASGIAVNWSMIRDAPRVPATAVAGGKGKLRIRAHLGTAFVACVRLFPGITSAMLDAVIRVRDLKGLVLETFGAGNAPLGQDEDGGLIRVLSEAKERDVVVVGVSQCMTGSVSAVYESGVLLMKAGVIPGTDLTTEAALTKLAFLFEGGEEEGGIEGPEGVETPRKRPESVDWAKRTERIREKMTESLRGEMSV